jgi:hypothetical protein
MVEKLKERISNDSQDEYALCRGVDVFVPAFDYIVAHASLPTDALQNNSVTIPTTLFKFLMSTWVRRQAFDEQRYLAANPDVKSAVAFGDLDSGKQHYVNDGYYEGRLPGEFAVDEAWYRATYPDIRVGEKKGLVASPTTHFNMTGRFEGRVGSKSQLRIKKLWDEALGVK